MKEIAPGVRQLDTLLGGQGSLTAAFLVDGAEPALVETGSQSSVPAVEAALAGAGLGPADLRWIVVTHIHLDHAGGVGDLAAAFPNATVVVHERGARHLVDPARLIDSAGRVYGALLDSVYGRMTPVPPERLVAAADGHRLALGGDRFLTLVDSPGHAKHHHAVLDETTGTLMVGDAVGVMLPGMSALRPATPPPDFDLEHAVYSLRRFRDLAPRQVVLTHYGPVDDGLATLADAEDRLHAWVAVAERVRREQPEAGVDAVAEAFARDFASTPAEVAAGAPDRIDLLNGLHSNAAGILRYLSRRDAQATG